MVSIRTAADFNVLDIKLKKVVN